MMTRAKLALLCGALGLLAGSCVLAESQPPAAPTPNDEETASEAAHVPPDPPQHPMGDMPYHEMTTMMQMDDSARTAKVLFDQLEWRNIAEGNAAVWDAEGWYGGDYNKVWLRSEGERVAGTTQNARADLLWDHTFARWWSVQAGGSQNFGARPGRARAATGVPGLAPRWFTH